MTYLRNMFDAHSKGDNDAAVVAGTKYFADCLAQVTLSMKMRRVLGVDQGEGVTKTLTVLLITLVALAGEDRGKFTDLLRTSRKFLSDDEGCDAMWELFHDYDFMEGDPDGRPTT